MNDKGKFNLYENKIEIAVTGNFNIPENIGIWSASITTVDDKIEGGYSVSPLNVGKCPRLEQEVFNYF